MSNIQTPQVGLDAVSPRQAKTQPFKFGKSPAVTNKVHDFADLVKKPEWRKSCNRESVRLPSSTVKLTSSAAKGSTNTQMTMIGRFS